MREAGAVEHIALVQSIPDFLYAHGRVMSENAEARVAVIAVLCASENIDEATWRAFKGKTVRIFPQNSETGLKAAERWWQQIADFDASKVDVFKLPDLKKADGTPVRELCDLAGMSPEQLDSDPKLRRILP
jgi:hypothetical protein